MLVDDDNLNEWDEDHAMDMVLNNMISQLRKVRVRYANESTYVIIENFDADRFKVEKEFDEDLYGIYNNSHVMVNKEDYNNYL
jgi:hypothetical protein